jgi:hypothetical protein
MNNNNNRNFLNYINTTLSKESLVIIYDANNIKFEKCELYRDFIQSLLALVFDTYMGDEWCDKDDQLKHFNWCWNKNIENFENEGFLFMNTNLYHYFKDYMDESFYLVEDKSNKKLFLTNMELWDLLFNFDSKKTSFDIDILIELYHTFNNSLVNKT